MKNKWVLTWTAGAETTTSYGKPTAVLTYVGPTPPFIAKVTYKRGEALPAWKELGARKQIAARYACSLAGIDREVRVTTQGAGCESIYQREVGKREILWHSGRDSEICGVKAAEFVTGARSKGIQCSPQ